MCGIVGMVSKWSNGFTSSEADIFTRMLFLDTLRGWDSTGVFGVDKFGNVDIVKAAISGPDFIRTREHEDFLRKSVRAGTFMVGHNRAATKGTINDENAHPFYVDDKIILVQNGTMRGDHKKFAEVDVDSHALAHLLAKEDDVTKALKQVNAAYALVWYNTATESMNIIRNKERPLFIVEEETGGFIFASEMETILYACSKSTTPVKWKSAPFLLDEHTLYEFSLTSPKEMKKTKLECEYEYPYATEHYDAEKWREAFRRANDDESGVSNVRSFPIQQHPGNTRQELNANDVEYPIHQVVCLQPEVATTFFFDSSEEAQQETDYIDVLIKPDGMAYIQVFDYYYANRRGDCSVFHVLACLYDDRNTAGVMIHWLEFNSSKKLVEEMVGQVYEAKLNTPVVYQFLDYNGDKKWYVRSYATSIEKVSVQ